MTLADTPAPGIRTPLLGQLQVVGAGSGEFFVRLLVEVVPVGDDDECPVPRHLAQDFLREEDYRKALTRALRLPENAGSSMDKVLQCRVFLNDLNDYDGMNEVFRGRFGDEPPVRTTIAAAGGIPGHSLVEIDVIAYI